MCDTEEVAQSHHAVSLFGFLSEETSAKSVGEKLLATLDDKDDRASVEFAAGAALIHVRKTEAASVAVFDHMSLQSVYQNPARYKKFLEAIHSFFKDEEHRFKTEWWPSLPRSQRCDGELYKRLYHQLMAIQGTYKNKVYCAKKREWRQCDELICLPLLALKNVCKIIQSRSHQESLGT
jgi:hypothetical protein